MLVQKAMRRLGVSLAVAGLSLGFVLSPIPALRMPGSSVGGEFPLCRSQERHIRARPMTVPFAV